MAYPSIYDVTYSYTGFQQSQGGNSFPGTQLDADLAGLHDSVSGLALFLQGVARSDGALQNGIVTYDGLSVDLQTAGLAPSYAWATDAQYFANGGAIINNGFYRATVKHVSGVFADDLAAGKWVFVSTLLQGIQGIQGIQGLPGSPITTIAALRALAPGVYTGVEVLGYYAVGDGGGGLFVWASTASAADNGGTIIQPTLGGTGRWVRQMPLLNVASPRMFGARGDGTNDATYVQTAIDTLYALGGGTLWFDTVYTVGAPGVLHANGFSIIDLKTGVNFDGPGGLKLADNVNVANAVFTASFSGTTMTVSALTSGVIVANQFETTVGIAAATQIVTQLGGTPGGVGTYQTTTSNTLSSATVKGVNRMVELIGNYASSPVVGINDTTYKNIILDYNGANNCATGTIWSFNAVVTIQTGADIVFDGVRFRDNCGSNTLVLGKYQAAPTVSRATVARCSFKNDGDRINAASVDYSTVFGVCAGLDIVDNRFDLGPVNNGVACEVYGSNINIAANRVSGYYGLANVVAIAGQTTQIVNICDNVVADCSIGVTLWALTATSKLYGVSVRRNTFGALVGAAGGPYLVNARDQVNASADLRNIVIDGNTFENFDLSDSSRTSDGISLKSFYGAKISDNVMYGIPGRAIHVTNALAGASLVITDNELVDCCYNGVTDRSWISLDAAATAGIVDIRGNTGNPINGYTVTTGIKNALAATSGNIKGNTFISTTTQTNNTGAGVAVDQVYGAGVSAFLATPSSANLATAVTDEDGSGKLVFSAGPKFTGQATNNDPAGGVGYSTGAGGTVTQATSKATGVSLSAPTGQITLNNAALAAATIVSFTLTNTAIAATDVLVINHISGGTVGAYKISPQCAAGSATINVRNDTAGTLSEAIVLQFALIKGATA